MLGALTWNLFHGRDDPPDPTLRTRRSKYLRLTERSGDHVQVNRSLRREFTGVLRELEWDVALLQEAPPRWFGRLRRELDADGQRALTSRNSLWPLRALGQLVNPDLIGSNEGGSNQLLARPPWRLSDPRTHVLTKAPERRVMMWATLERPEGGVRVAVANLHGSVDSVPGAPDQVLAAAERAVEWAGDLPLLFGGDLNLRPHRHREAFEELERRFGLSAATGEHAIDHLLVRGLEEVSPPSQLRDSVREVKDADGRAIRLSDHACVVATFGVK